MTAVWDKIQQLAEQIEQKFSQSGEQYSSTEHNYNWYNSLYSSPRYRRAHVEIVDNRQTHKIYILHSTIFAHFNDPSPIWGFDAVCGPNKITGAFHDFSAAGDPNHSMIKWFATESAQLEWNKPRELPDWARQIFTPHMIAAGNVNDGAELDALCDMALRSLDYYLINVGNTQTAGADYHMAQNRYCYYQKQNPHVIKSMVAMGVEETTMHQFVNEILFPEVV
jgi:hypothetical protein